MTLHHVSCTVKKEAPTITVGRFCFGFFALFCLALILRNSQIAIEYISRGLLLCAKTVIPSLFPFMVLSELLVSGGIEDALPKWVLSPFRRLFGLSDAGCCAVLLGFLCGFPVGAKCALLAYERGRLTKEEAERTLTFSNNPSSAFLISAVGVSLWGSRRFGIALYATVLAVSVITGVVINRLRKKDTASVAVSFESYSSARPLTGAKLFTESVRSATGSILLVCAYVIFFSALMGTLNIALASLDLPFEISTLLFCVFEISGGVSQASALDSPLLAAALCAFAAGWSGLSVHCQVLSVCDGKGFSFRAYFLAKLAQGLLAACIVAFLVYLFPSLTVPAENCVS